MEPSRVPAAGNEIRVRQTAKERLTVLKELEFRRLL